MENDPMKISFVIPAYNEELYIEKCLRAILREIGGREDAEIIVVDNNSTDRTAEVVRRYPKVRLIVATVRGANSARETGFRASRGELVAFPDADTEIPPGWVAKAEREFRGNSNLACLSGPFIYYDLPKRVLVLVRLFYFIAYVVYWFNRFVLKKTSVIQGGNYVARRSALEKIGGHNTALSFYGDDADLALRLSKVGEVKFSFNFSTRSSGRRLAKEGLFTMGGRYALNYFWIAFFRKPFTTKSIEVRPTNNALAYRPDNEMREAALITIVLLVFFAVVGGIAYVIYRFAF
jgi:glycosyltransferase involved in cell wall biosynthesis